jgi:hypothetical protein
MGTLGTFAAQVEAEVLLAEWVGECRHAGGFTGRVMRPEEILDDLVELWQPTGAAGLDVFHLATLVAHIN